MLLGKRPRPPMKRTTSMSEITFDLNTTASDVAPVDPNSPLNRPRMAEPVGGGGLSGGGGSYGADGTWKQQNGLNGLDQRVFASFSARNYKRHSTNFVQTADFLRSCSLCRSSLVPGRDIYMYRGDTAFCSLECRQQQMNQDEKKEKKCLLASKKQVVASASGSKVSTKGDTLATL